MATKVASLYAEISADTSKLESGLATTKSELSSAGSGIKKFGGLFQDLTGISLGAVGAIGLAGIGIKKVGDFARDSVNETVTYNKTMREMAQTTGLGAEEISRIVQVGDDWGIKIEALRTSLAFMNKSGVTPSIDNLADLADEYVNASDKAEWANNAVKTLGRGYETLIPLLALGGDGFRDAAAGIDESLIATEADMKKSREFEVAMDDLTDSATGLKYAVGNELIPTLVDLLGPVNENVSKFSQLRDLVDKLETAESLGLITTADLVKVRIGLATHTMNLDDISVEYADVLDALKTTTLGATEAEKLYTIGRGKLAGATEDATVYASSYVVQLHKVIEATSEAREGVIEYTDTNAIATEKLWSLDEALDDALGDETERYKQNIEDISGKTADLRFRIAELEGQEFLTDEQKQELGDLKLELEEVSGEFAQNAADHEIAVNKIIFNLAREQLALNNIDVSTQAEILDELAQKLGIVDANAYLLPTAIQGITEAFGDIPSPSEANIDDYNAALDFLAEKAEHGTLKIGDVDTAMGILEGRVGIPTRLGENFQGAADGGLTAAESKTGAIVADLHEIEGTHKVTIDISVIGQMPTLPSGLVGNPRNQTPDQGVGGAMGLSNFIVPPGYPYDNYRIGVSSGERVNVDRVGEERGMGGGLNIESIVINAGAGANGFQLFQQFKQALESEMRAAGRGGVPYSDY